MKTIEQKSIDTIRMLSVDMIEKAKSGHPGITMGAAPMAYTLFSKFMNVSPSNPEWMNRDRFVLSAGHGSALLYSLLHVFEYDVTVEDLKNFRQLNSRTPGHPEYGFTKGVDATTGPLGQGIGMAVGMALAETHLAAKYNRDQFNVMDHFTYVLCGDGDLMEGVSSEVASLAGHLSLGKLIVLYDSNDISLDGRLDMSFSENVEQRFGAYHWQYLRVEDGNDIAAIAKAITAAKADPRPTLIEVKTTIGFGSPNKGGLSASHGAPLGSEEVKLVRKNYEYSEAPFVVADDVKAEMKKMIESKEKKYEAWTQLFHEYTKAYPELAQALIGSMNKGSNVIFDEELVAYDDLQAMIATRVASSDVIQAIAKKTPHFIGGSADLASSNNTLMKAEGMYSATNRSSRNIYFGVREFGEGTVLNGMALHGGLRVYGSTFFVFSDYMRPAIRLAALMNLPVTYVFTHDSIAVGEDGPTHEPIEQLAALRAMPNVHVIRPADAKETVAAWKQAMASTSQPTALILSRQVLPVLKNDQAEIEAGMKQGAYVVSAAQNKKDAIIIATGSEVSLALSVQAQLRNDNIDIEVVSMPSWMNFKKLSKTQQEAILPNNVKKISLEAASTLGWAEFVKDGLSIGINEFGVSAPAADAFQHFGFTTEAVVAKIKQFMN